MRTTVTLDDAVLAIDVPLFGSVMIGPGGALWTADKRLRAAASDGGAGLP